MQQPAWLGSVVSAVAIGFLLLPGCVQPPAPENSSTGQPLTVYFENDGRSDLSFRFFVDSTAPLLFDLPASNSAPNVRTGYRGNVSGESFPFSVDELSLGLHAERTFNTAARNFLIVEVYANGTMDVFHRDTQPYFD